MVQINLEEIAKEGMVRKPLNDQLLTMLLDAILTEEMTTRGK